MFTRYLMVFAMAMFLIAGVWGSALAQTEEELIVLHHARHEALNAHNLDEYQTYFADDVVTEFVGILPPASGKEGLLASLGAFLQGFPDLKVTESRLLVSGNIMATEHMATGTHSEEWFGIPATGKTVRSPHMDIIEFEGDKVKRITTYMDMTSILIQLGVMPASELPPLEPSFALPDAEPTGLSPLEATAEVVARLNTHDLSNLAKIIQPDAEILIAPLGATLNRDTFIAAEELYFMGWPDLHSDIVRTIDLGDGWTVSEQVYQGTNNGPYFGIPATGRSATLRAGILRRFDADWSANEYECLLRQPDHTGADGHS